MTLEAGDIIATGTLEGVGPIMKMDVVTAEIEGIGKVRFEGGRADYDASMNALKSNFV